MTIEEIRKEMDALDDKIADLFVERMNCAALIAEEKRKNKLPVESEERRKYVENRIAGRVPKEYSSYARALFSTMMSLSYSFQNELVYQSSLGKILEDVLKESAVLPGKATVAYGDDRAELAVRALFSRPDSLKLNGAGELFDALDKGLCDYGVVAASAGAAEYVHDGYDLLAKHGCYILARCETKQGKFLLISKKLQIFPDADKISFIMSLQNRPGALNAVLSKFYSMGINITKLETRDVHGDGSVWSLYLDVEANVREEGVAALLTEFESSPDRFTLLGCYPEKTV